MACGCPAAALGKAGGDKPKPSGARPRICFCDCCGDSMMMKARNVCAARGGSFAPAVFADEPEAKRAWISNKAFAAAMSPAYWRPSGSRVVTEEGRHLAIATRLAEVAPSANGVQQPANNAPRLDFAAASPRPPLSTPFGWWKVEGGLLETRPTFTTAAARREVPAAQGLKAPLPMPLARGAARFRFGSRLAAVPRLVEVD